MQKAMQHKIDSMTPDEVAAFTSSPDLMEKIIREVARTKVKQWTPGKLQEVQGEVLHEFAEQFLARLPDDERQHVESKIVNMHKSQFKRFRIKMINELAMSFQRGADAAKAGEEVDMTKLVKDITERRMKHHFLSK
jgi:hypothetical protein